MFDIFDFATTRKRLSDFWKVFRYDCDFGPPPWHEIECVDFIDLGGSMSVLIRENVLDDGSIVQFADIWHDYARHASIALIHTRDLPELIELLTQTQEVIEQRQRPQSLAD